MNCLKCGSKNLTETLICQDCGFNNHKGYHIDIEDIRPVSNNNNHNINHVRHAVFALFIFVIIAAISFFVTLGIYIFKDKSNAKIIDEYNTLVKNGETFAIYIGNNKELSDSINLYSTYYEFKFLNINKKNLTKKNRNKFKKILKIDNLTNAVAVYKNGKFKASTTVNDKNELNKFLNDNNLIPNVLENPNGEREKLTSVLKSTEDTLVYITFVNNDIVTERDTNLAALAENYKINYQFIRGYVFSEKQIMDYLSQLGYSSMQNELILILENGKIKKTIVLESLYFDDYIEIFQNYDIINTTTDYLDYIDFNTFKNIIKSREKSVVVIGDDKCKYCENLKYTLGSLVKEKNIKIYYLNIVDEDITSELKNLKYNGTITYPLTVVLENENIIDSVIGDSEKEIYINLFTKLGIIR